MTELTLSPDEFGRMSAADHHAAWAIMPVSKAGTVKESPFAPLHTFGLSVDYNSFPGLTANLRTAFLYPYRPDETWQGRFAHWSEIPIAQILGVSGWKRRSKEGKFLFMEMGRTSLKPWIFFLTDPVLHSVMFFPRTLREMQD
jgi:hypothetical protein